MVVSMRHFVFFPHINIYVKLHIHITVNKINNVESKRPLFVISHLY